MKMRNRVLRFVAIAAIAAAGAGIAIMASNEEGRARLVRTRDAAAKSALKAAEYLNTSWQSANQWVESNRRRDETNDHPTDYQQNGASQHHYDLSYMR